MITSDRAGLVQVMLIMAWLVLDRELRIDPIEQVLKLQCPCSANIQTGTCMAGFCGGESAWPPVHNEVLVM